MKHITLYVTIELIVYFKLLKLWSFAILQMCWGYNDSKQWIQDNVYMHKYHVHHHKETTHTALELVKSEVHLIPSKAMYTDYTATISTLWPSLLVGHTNFTFSKKKESTDCMQPIIKKKHPQLQKQKLRLHWDQTYFCGKRCDNWPPLWQPQN